MPLNEERKSRSPLPDPSLPQPGDSATQALWDQISDILLLVLPPFAVFCIAVVEWVHYALREKPHPFILTAAFIVLSGVSLWKGRRAWRRLESLGLGVRGERFVGQTLEKLRAHGYHVFHDLVEDDYNIDHVLIGPGGVFSIETKTRSKPGSGTANVVVDGERITVAGWTPDRDPIAQAEAAARRVRGILLAQTGREVACTPVVLFPGWYVETRNLPKSVFVMNPTYFAKWITGRPKRMSRDEVTFHAAGMERYLKERRREN